MNERVCIAGMSLLAFAAAIPAGQAPGIRREGPFFVLTAEGAESVSPREPVRVATRGTVVARGAAGNQVSWRLTTRVRARDEADAQRMLRDLEVRANRVADGANLSVRQTGVDTRLELNVPRGLPELGIATTGGAIEVTDLEGSVAARSAGGRVMLDRIGGKVLARTGGGEVILGKIGGSADCVTAGGPIRAESISGEAVFETGGGEIAVGQVGGMVRATTAGGGIRIDKAHSVVFANTAGGPIAVRYANGMVEARNAGGPIHVSSAGGCRCETADGAIYLSAVWGTLRASTGMGSIYAQLLAGKPLADSVLRTGSGDITVLIPSNLGVSIQARNEAADTVRRIISEYSGISVQLVGGSVIAEGDINGGGPVLRISGNGGTIFIKRLN
jgi:hypothetical protein